MKFNNIFYSTAVLAVAGLMGSCSDKYLDLAPMTSVSTNDMVSTVDGAQLAMIGVCNAMWQQYQDYESYNCFNGEAYINHRMNDAFGQDDHVGIGLQQWGYEIMCGGSPWEKDNYVLNALPWKYYYNLISQANTIIAYIDDASGDANKRDFVKAQLLTLRAHAYTKLMMYYAPRWEDSNNGDVLCAVMRTEPGVGDAPLATMNDFFKLIYSDLDTAIALYKSSGLERDYKWMPDINVAYGIYARAAMVIHDFTTAQTMAHNASQGYKVMDNNTYLSGFYNDNDDFMWTASPDETDIYYWSETAFFATNAVYPYKWRMSDCIDLDLYRQLDPNDVRRLCYFTPDKIEYIQKIDKEYNPANITADAFWNGALVNENDNCDVSTGPYSEKNAVDGSWGLYNVALYYSLYYANNIFTGNLAQMGNEDKDNRLVQYDYVLQYATPNGGAIRLDSNSSASLASIGIGAQYKFWSIAPYSSGYYLFMRATEMKLIEAEAAYYNQDATTALAILKEINGMRISGYNFSGSGQALLDEIRLCRRIELWGEGHNWTDFKRWSLPITRNVWKENDPTSGNWQSDFGVNTPVNVNSGWRMRVPRSEIELNKAVDQTALEQSYK